MFIYFHLFLMCDDGCLFTPRFLPYDRHHPTNRHLYICISRRVTQQKNRFVPIIGRIVGGWIFKKLAFVFELASNFIAAHEDIDILELLPAGIIGVGCAIYLS